MILLHLQNKDHFLNFMKNIDNTKEIQVYIVQAENLNLNISNDAKIEGANIKAKDINVNVGNNLTIASLQNSSSSKDNGHTYKSYGAPMSDKDISVIFNIDEKEYIRKNEGDYVANPINIFAPSTWNKPGHGTENYKPIQ